MFSKQVTHILLLGELHRDPAAPKIVTELLNKAINRNQPVILCDEEDPTSTLEYKLKGNLQFLELNKKLIELFSLDPFLKHDLKRTYFPLSSLAQIMTAFGSEFSSKAAWSHAMGLLRHASWPERINMWKSLKEHHIPNYSVDASADIRTLAQENQDSFINVEHLRITEMAKNLMKIANTHLPMGGLIIFFGGMNHIPVLYAALKALTQEKSANQEIFIQAKRLYSKYVEDGLESHKESLPDLKKQLTENVQKFYNLESCSLEFCSENKIDGSFNACILEQLGDNFYTQYTIPDFTEDKAKFIQSIFGVVLDQSETGSAVVAIHSAYLVASIRKFLGIERLRLTIKSEISAKIEYLKKHCPDMAIEPEGSNKFLVTFPTSDKTLADLEVVTQMEKWQTYCKNQTLTLSL